MRIESEHRSAVAAEDFLSQCRAGKPDALERLYRSHHQTLLEVARHYVADPDAARDVEHDAWVMILTSLHSLNNASSLNGWMFKIVRNTALNYLKHQRASRQVPIEQAEGLEHESSDIPFPPLPTMIGMVERLPEGYRQVFRLHTFDGLTHSQIGELLGITAGASRSQLSRARNLLRQMMLRYWAIVLLMLLVPLATWLFWNSEEGNKPASDPPTAGLPASKQPAAPLQPEPSVPSPAAEPPLAAATSAPPPITPAFTIDSTGTIVGTNAEGSLLAAQAHIAATIAPPETMVPQLPPAASVKCDYWPLVRRQKQAKPWQLHLAYGGNGGMASTITDNFLTVVNFANGESERGTRLYTWGDYYRYVDENASLMDSVDASRMTAIANRHANKGGEVPAPSGDATDSYNDATPLSETKRHERPRTIQLSLSVPLSQRWSLNSGLGFTWMKSTFEADNGNGNDITRRTQRLYYLNVPLGATYTIWQRNRLSVYASGSMRLDIPVKGHETTEWVYTGRFDHAPGDSLVFPTTHATVKAPWQWSVGANVGIQYQLLPHVKAYFEPGFRYYFPTGSPVETYRTEHPFDVAFPFGIRITP